MIKQRSSKWHKLNIIADIFLIIIILLIGWYIYSNFELFKDLNRDVCAYCMEKTGAVCYSSSYAKFINETIEERKSIIRTESFNISKLDDLVITNQSNNS